MEHIGAKVDEMPSFSNVIGLSLFGLNHFSLLTGQGMEEATSMEYPLFMNHQSNRIISAILREDMSPRKKAHKI